MGPAWRKMAWEMEPWEKSDREGIACVNTIRLLCPGGKAGAARPMLHRWMKIYEDKEECAAKKGGYTQIYSYFNILPNLALGGNMGFVSCIVDTEGRRQIKRWLQGQPSQPVEKPLGVRGPQPPEAIIGFGGVYGKSAKSLA